MSFKPGDGVFSFDVRKSRECRKWMISQSIYMWVAKLLYILQLQPLSYLHCRLFGAKIGMNVFLGGYLFDPWAIEIEDDVVGGGLTLVFGHAVEYDFENRRAIITISKTKISKASCTGANSVVMTGSTMEEESVLGALSLLVKNRSSEFQKAYGGVPGKEIKPRVK
ncbi:MAG: hypothetical protein GY714_14965 [Desulfobacterales bacterium]|nr:hypothetical protein [Desulfobacterales bacterium]